MEDLPSPKSQKSGIAKRIIFGQFIVSLVALNLLLGKYGAFNASAQSPAPTPDRLAEPEISENPTQYEEGQYLYWMHCMPCHGDYGQGLTDEFRELWVEDHQNCWGRGCHGGRAMDEGFPIPKSIPAIISTTGDVLAIQDADMLFEYLHSTHPPQHPGYLIEKEYWAMTAYVLAENGIIKQGREIGPYASGLTEEKILSAAVAGMLLLAFGGMAVWTKSMEMIRVSHSQYVDS